MLDCHIIVSADTPREWVAQCLDSVHEAADRAGYPVAVHVVDGVPGHIGKARAVGYAMGSQPYVTSVDDDDWIASDAFSCLLDALTAAPAAIYTHETTWQNGKPRRCEARQSLRVFRRDVIDGVDLLHWPVLDSLAVIAHADHCGAAITVPRAVYHYRLDPASKARRLMAAHPDVTAEARALHG